MSDFICNLIGILFFGGFWFWFLDKMLSDPETHNFTVCVLSLIGISLFLGFLNRFQWYKRIRHAIDNFLERHKTLDKCINCIFALIFILLLWKFCDLYAKSGLHGDDFFLDRPMRFR